MEGVTKQGEGQFVNEGFDPLTKCLSIRGLLLYKAVSKRRYRRKEVVW
jgi:hypothetical protein